MKLDLDEAIQWAAKDLPEGWVIRLCVENGAGWVTVRLWDHDVTDECDLCPDVSLAEQIFSAVEHAKTRGTASGT